jgi:adenosyl cobinamide kinase/adenosyl cobinamide phosphate guanylyltransferase
MRADCLCGTYIVRGGVLILVIGGAYQGKLDYVKERFGISESDVHFCSDTDSDMPHDKRVIHELDKWILALLRVEKNVREYAQQFIENHGDAVVTCNDISSGVVPTEAVLREWREAVGRSLNEMAQSSEEVVRLFCGIPTRIK